LATAETTNAPLRLDYDSFRVISDRNIFNPNRYARSSTRTTRTETRPAARVEAFTLVGLMAYEKGVFAFFDGTSASYKKTLEANGEISEFKAAEVTPDELKLVSGTNEFVLHVGMQVRREDEGHWFLTEASPATPNRVVVSRARMSGPSDEPVTGDSATNELSADGMPEVIFVNPETGGVNGLPEGTSPAAESTDGEVTDPVLLRLMQRRQEMNQ
jgi:hypothetical protein